MKYQSLYDEFKLKQSYQEIQQQSELQRIRKDSTRIKINQNSTQILKNKLIILLEQFNDEQIINIESCIPILYRIGILQVLCNMQSAKIQLSKEIYDNQRLKWQAKFIYYLWRIIDEQEIQTRKLKQILFLFYEKKGQNLKNILQQMYNNNIIINNLIQAWNSLSNDRQYYDNCKIINKKKTLNKQNFIKKLNSVNSNSKSMNQFHRNNTLKNLEENSIHYNNDSKLSNAESSFMLSHNKEKQLIDRLYNKSKYQLRETMAQKQNEQKMKDQMQKCTFKPNLIQKQKNVRGRSKSQSKQQIRGFQKAVSRMKVGAYNSKVRKQLTQYKCVGQNYEYLKEKGINPPKFLSRKKEEEIILFLIEFQLGRHKIKVKVHPTDTEDSIATNLCKVYGLKAPYYEQIRDIIHHELSTYYKEQEKSTHPS